MGWFDFVGGIFVGRFLLFYAAFLTSATRTPWMMSSLAGMRSGKSSFSARRNGLPSSMMYRLSVVSPSIRAATTSPFLGSRNSRMTVSPSHM